MHSPQEVRPLSDTPALTFPEQIAPRTARWAHRFIVVAAVLVGVAYVVYFAMLTAPPMQDFPNHLARATVMADLLFDGGARFGHLFGVQVLPIPYVLHDLVFATLVQLFGPTIGGSIFLTIVLLSLPASLWFYMRALQVAPRARLLVLLLSLVLATDWFFLMAFMAFRLALAFVVVSLALAEMLRRRWSVGLYATYLGVLVAAYLTHLSAPVFFLVVVTVSAAVRLIVRSSTLTREAQLVLPVVLILGVHLVLSDYTRDLGPPAVFLYEWGRLSDKFHFWWYEFARFGGRTSQVLIGLLAICVLMGVRRALTRENLKSPLFIESVLIAVAFVGVYILLPREYEDSAYVDVRALTMISLFLLIAALWLVHEVRGRGFDSLPVLALALTLSVLNLGWIAWKMAPLEDWLKRYREMVAVVPAGARVLPVSTRPKVGGFSPFLQIGAYLVVDRGSAVPYLFSRDRGDPMKFFYYRGRTYTPQENWYPQQKKWLEEAVPATYNVLGQNYTWRFLYSEADGAWKPFSLVPIEWGPVACDYDWLFVSRPYESKQIGVQTRLVRQNEAAALLQIDKSACRPRVVRPVRLPSEH